MKKEITTLVSVVIICATIFGVTHNFKNTGISIKNTGTMGNSVQNSINVKGEGKATATPDIVRIQAGVSETKNTTKEAQEATNKKIATILEILKKYNIPEKNIQTANLSFDEEYNWENNKKAFIGQRVRQTLNIKIPEIIKNPNKITDIVDELATIDGLELNSVTFDIEDKKEFFTKAREEAYAKAKQKAEELAKLGEVKLLQPITISEAQNSYFQPVFSNIAKVEMSMDDAGGASLPTGELEITANLNIVFGIE